MSNIRGRAVVALIIESLEHRSYLAAISFAPAKSFAAGAATQGIVTGDFNRDGKLDVAVTEYGDGVNGKLDILLGDGAGNLGSPTKYNTTADASGVVSGDLNGDGVTDLVVTGQTVEIFLGLSNGTFKKQSGFAGGDTPQNSTLADLNKDGKLDLVVANVLDTSASIFTGKGTGAFNAETNPAIHNGADIAVGDINGDGKLDLVAAKFGDLNTATDTGVAVLTGKGDGTFNAATSYAVNARPSGIRLGDFNSDGKLDIVVANGGFEDLGGADNFSLLTNKGNGTFNNAVNIASAEEPNALAVADFDGDGFLDVAAPGSDVNSAGPRMRIHQGKGDGTFLASTAFAIDGGSAGVAAGDFNGDGLPDLVNSVTQNGHVNLLVNNTAFASLNAGLLQITGTPNADTITITARSGKYSVTRNGSTSSFNVSNVTRVKIIAGDGNDKISVGALSVTAVIAAGSGNDTVVGSAALDSITGGAGKDIIYGGEGDDVISGNNGVDLVYGEGGSDRLYGGDGDDHLDGGGGGDRLYGDEGADVLEGGSSNDRIYGRAGNDKLFGGKGRDYLDGGDGADEAKNDGTDILNSIEA